MSQTHLKAFDLAILYHMQFRHLCHLSLHFDFDFDSYLQQQQKWMLNWYRPIEYLTLLLCACNRNWM